MKTSNQPIYLIQFFISSDYKMLFRSNFFSAFISAKLCILKKQFTVSTSAVFSMSKMQFASNGGLDLLFLLY